MAMSTQVVRWQNGEYDSDRVCQECESIDCEHSVHGRLTATGDGYREVVTRQTYWDWCEQHASHHKDTRFIEPTRANPDFYGDIFDEDGENE